jgi:predicted nucleic acid-binding protein
MRLIDTDIFINLSRNKLKRSLLKWDQSDALSDISYMEFVQGCRDNKELILWKKVCQHFTLLPVTEEISHRARTLMDHFSLSQGMQLGDALIAATALFKQRILMTGNKKHFDFVPGLETHFVKIGL